jgi:hypothetical protein
VAAERPSPVDRLVARGGVRREVAATTGRPAGVVVGPPAATAAGRASLARGVTDELPASNLDMAVFQRAQNRGGGKSGGGVTRKVFKSVFVAILILCSGLVAMASFDPGMRDKMIAWADKAKTWTASTIHSIRTAAPVAQPDRMSPGGELARANGAPSSLEESKLRMWELWKAGVEAEKRGDFTAAVRSWEQIKGLKVPAEELPLGFDGRLATAKKRVK